MAGCTVLCPPNVSAPTNFQSALTKLDKKKFGFTGFALIRKGVVISNPSDIASWTAVASDIECGPCGTVNLGTPSYSTDDNGCGGEEIDETIYNITITTKYLDKSGLTHVKYFRELLQTYRCYNIIVFDCDDHPILTGEYQDFLHGITTTPPVGSPGFEFTLTQSPAPSQGNNNREQWTWGIQIKLDGEEMLGQSPIPGLYAAIC